MYSELTGRGYEVYEAGDGIEVGNIATSIYSGFMVAKDL